MSLNPSTIPIPQTPQGPQAVNPFPIAIANMDIRQRQNENLNNSILNVGKTYNTLQQQRQQRQLDALSAISQLYGYMPRDIAGQYVPQLQRMYGLDNSQQQAQSTIPAGGSPSNGGGGGVPTFSAQVPQQQPQALPSPSSIGQNGTGGSGSPSGSSIQPVGQGYLQGVTQPSEHIINSVNAGAPDFTGHLAKVNQIQQQIAGLSNEGPVYAQRMMPTLMGQLNAEKAAMDAEQAPMQYAKNAQELANAQQQIPMEKAKVAASAAQKIGPNMASIKLLQSTFDQINSLNNDPSNKSIPGIGNLGAKYASFNPNTTSRWAQNQSSAEGIANVGAGAIEKLVEGRYNDQQKEAIKQAFFPTGNVLGTPIAQQRLGRLQNYITQARQGNLDEFKSVVDAIAGGGGNVGALGQPAPFPNQPLQVTAQDHNAALTWARSNPNDPRAKAVLAKAQSALGVGGP